MVHIKDDSWEEHAKATLTSVEQELRTDLKQGHITTKDPANAQEEDYGPCFELDDSWEELADLTMQDQEQGKSVEKDDQEEQRQDQIPPAISDQEDTWKDEEDSWESLANHTISVLEVTEDYTQDQQSADGRRPKSKERPHGRFGRRSGRN